MANRRLITLSTLILACFAVMGCSSLLYYPDHVMYVEPETMEFKPEDCVYHLPDGSPVHAWYFSSAKPPKAVIVFFHGNAQNRTSHIVGLYWLIREGYDLLAVEYPGYGETDGSPSPQNTVETGHAALRYIAARKPGLPIIVYGQSIGGAIAMRAALDMKNEVKPALVVADSTFLTYKKAAQKIMTKSWLTWPFQLLPWLVLSDEFAPGKAIAELSPIPLLVIHSREDNIVPFELGEEVYNSATQPKEFWPMEHGGHISTYTAPSGIPMRVKLLDKLSQMGL